MNREKYTTVRRLYRGLGLAADSGLTPEERSFMGRLQHARRDRLGDLADLHAMYPQNFPRCRYARCR